MEYELWRAWKRVKIAASVNKRASGRSHSNGGCPGNGACLSGGRDGCPSRPKGRSTADVSKTGAIPEGSKLTEDAVAR
jgi:hypothetical protein